MIYRFRVSETITADNGQPFKSGTLYKLYERYRIKGNHSSRYYAPANGLAEPFNKTLRTILEKMVDKNKKTWLEKLPEALWAYRTTVRTATQAMTYPLVFGGEVVLLLEIPKSLPKKKLACVWQGSRP